MNISPCKKRPDTEESCPLLNYPKDNQVCYTCNLCGRGKKKWDTKEIQLIIDNKELNNYADSHNADMKKIGRCKWPTEYCENNRTSKTDYCLRHNSVLRNRKNSNWPKSRMFEPIKSTKKRW